MFFLKYVTESPCLSLQSQQSTQAMSEQQVSFVTWCILQIPPSSSPSLHSSRYHCHQHWGRQKTGVLSYRHSPPTHTILFLTLLPVLCQVACWELHHLTLAWTPPSPVPHCTGEGTTWNTNAIKHEIFPTTSAPLWQWSLSFCSSRCQKNNMN